jgi:hypothetical protein
MIHEHERDGRLIPDYFKIIQVYWPMIIGAIFITCAVGLIYVKTTVPYNYRMAIKSEISSSEIHLMIQKKILPQLFAKFSNSNEYKNIKVKLNTSAGNGVIIMMLEGGDLGSEKSKSFLKEIALALADEFKNRDGAVDVLEQQRQELVGTVQLLDKDGTKVQSEIKNTDGLIRSILARTPLHQNGDIFLIQLLNDRQSLLHELQNIDTRRHMLRTQIIDNNAELQRTKNVWERFVFYEPEQNVKYNLPILLAFFAAMGLIAGLIVAGCIEFYRTIKIGRIRRASPLNK